MLFFSPNGANPPCGMFTTSHLIALVICIILITIGVYFSIKLKEKQVYRIIQIIAVIVTILEIIKIAYNFYYGYTNLDSWLPLAFCSLFIYSIWMAGFGHGKVQKMGISFLVGGGIMAGLAFLIFPTTSLMMHPIFHFLSMHSMIFHSLMIYVGIICYVHQFFQFNRQNYFFYLTFCLIFMVIALIINKIYGCNMMFLREPFNIPITILKDIQNKAQWLYTIIMIGVYLIVPYGIVHLLNKLIKYKGDTNV